MANVMYININHPKYDLNMELLCLLPCAPNSARSTELAKDLGLSCTEDLDELLVALRTRLYNITELESSGHSFYTVEYPHWIEVRHDAQAYWDKVYEPRRK